MHPTITDKAVGWEVARKHLEAEEEVTSPPAPTARPGTEICDWGHPQLGEKGCPCLLSIQFQTAIPASFPF